MLLRAEFMYGEASEVLVAEHTILGERRRAEVGAEVGWEDVGSAPLCCVNLDNQRRSAQAKSRNPLLFWRSIYSMLFGLNLSHDHNHISAAATRVRKRCFLKVLALVIAGPTEQSAPPFFFCAGDVSFVSLFICTIRPQNWALSTGPFDDVILYRQQQFTARRRGLELFLCFCATDTR